MIARFVEKVFYFWLPLLMLAWTLEVLILHSCVQRLMGEALPLVP